MECDAMTPAPDYGYLATMAIFDAAYREAVQDGLSVRRAEQIAADAAGYGYLNRRGDSAKDFK